MEDIKSFEGLARLATIDDEHARARALTAKLKELIEEKMMLKQELHNEREARKAVVAELKLANERQEARASEIRILRRALDVVDNLACALTRRS